VIIYEPSGKAGEYSPLAANLYRGCDHACEYCYAPAALRMKVEEFQNPSPRKEVIEQLKKDTVKMHKVRDCRPVLLSFTSDPYQSLDVEHELTRQALQNMFYHKLNVSILTKGGKRSERDFDLLTDNKTKCQYGVTLVFADDKEALKREPGAAPTSERIESLMKAHALGIKTWVSFEPVYNPEDCFKLIEQTKGFVDLFKVGKLNYRPEAKLVDWSKFAHEVRDRLEQTGVEYYIKDDLRKYLK